MIITATTSKTGIKYKLLVAADFCALQLHECRFLVEGKSLLHIFKYLCVLSYKCSESYIEYVVVISQSVK